MKTGPWQLTCVCAATLWLCACASNSTGGGPGEVPLTAEELKAMFTTPVHKDVFQNGDRGEGVVNADGTFDYTYMPKSGKPESDTGHWTLKEGNVTCVTWNKWKPSCAAWFKDPNGGYVAHDAAGGRNTVHVTVEQK